MKRIMRLAYGMGRMTGTSIAVYKPQDFDEANPACHVRTWDADGNMTERMVKEGIS